MIFYLIFGAFTLLKPSIDNDRAVTCIHDFFKRLTAFLKFGKLVEIFTSWCAVISLIILLFLHFLLFFLLLFFFHFFLFLLWFFLLFFLFFHFFLLFLLLLFVYWIVLIVAIFGDWQEAVINFDKREAI